MTHKNNIRAFAGRHYPALDGIRGFAILLVVFYHLAIRYRSFSSSHLDDFMLSICQIGWIGVDLFFVLSGFLITGILLDTRTSHNYLVSFFGRRVLRIFPAYYFTLVVFFVLLPRISSLFPSGLGEMIRQMGDYQIWFWSYTVNWLFALKGSHDFMPGGYYWSLAVEEQFYIVWPFAILFFHGARLNRLISYLLITNFALRIYFLVNGWTTASVYVMTFTHMDGLLCGALLASVIRTKSSLIKFFITVKYCAAVSCFILVAVGLYKGHFHFWDLWIAFFGYSLLAICFLHLVVVAIYAEEKTLYYKFFSHPFLRSFGHYSYAIYLTHAPIGIVLAKLFPLVTFAWMPIRATVMLLFSVAICWLAGYLSWHVYEKHFLKFKPYFSCRLSMTD